MQKILVMIFISRSVCCCVPVASVQVIFVSLAGTQLNCKLSFHDSDHTVFAPQTALFGEQQQYEPHCGIKLAASGWATFNFMCRYILGKPWQRKQGLYLSQILTANSESAPQRASSLSPSFSPLRTKYNSDTDSFIHSIWTFKQLDLIHSNLCVSKLSAYDTVYTINYLPVFIIKSKLTSVWTLFFSWLLTVWDAGSKIFWQWKW